VFCEAPLIEVGQLGLALICEVDLTGPRGRLGHIVIAILSVLNRSNVGSITLATVGASKRLPSDMH